MAQNPVVTFEMENGSVFKAELYPEIAPNTVNNFISLVNKSFYDGIIFHRVIRGFMIQALPSLISTHDLSVDIVLNLLNGIVPSYSPSKQIETPSTFTPPFLFISL